MGLLAKVQEAIASASGGRKLHVVMVGALGAIVLGVAINLISYWLTKPLDVRQIAAAKPTDPLETAAPDRGPGTPASPHDKPVTASPPIDPPGTFCNQINYATNNPELDSMYTAAWQLEHGTGARTDYAQARALYQDAGYRGHRASQYNAAVLMHRGLGGPLDNPGAVRFFKMAAAQNDYLALLNLALAYSDPWKGIEADFAKALEYYLTASRCDRGNVSNNIGVIFALGGRGVERDIQKAASWFRKAEAQGSEHAADNLGVVSDGFDPATEKVFWDDLGPVKTGK